MRFPFFSRSSKRLKTKKASKRPRALLALESLEDRITPADLVVTWNNVLLDAIRIATPGPGTSPPAASRMLAIMHSSIYDAVNAIDRTFEPYLVDTTAIPGTSMEAAVASAAYTSLTSLFSFHAQYASVLKPMFDTALADSLAAIPDGASEDNGVALGEFVATEILAIRSTDGSADAAFAWPDGTDPGVWRRTPSAFANALYPGWGDVTPFAMTDNDQFDNIPGLLGIPDLNSPEYTAAFNEVKVIGASDAETADRDGNSLPDRTAEQSAIAQFWANGPTTSTPPGHLNVMAQIVSEAEGLSLVENARLFAMINVALADAAILCWDFKYDTNFWRPITGIQEGDNDGNDDTVGEATWTSFIGTPPFPSYTSGHSTFSAAAAAILEAVFGADPSSSVSFVLPSENPSAGDRSFTATEIDGVERTSYYAAAYESALSRLYGGIHWSFDNFDGLDTGYALGEFIGANFFQPIAVGTVAAASGSDLVRVFNDDSSLRFEFHAFGGFSGGVTVALGDVSGDGTDDIIVGAGPGGGPHVKVFDGVDGSLIRSFFAFGAGFNGGVFVSAGDVNGDTIDDIIVGAGAGGGPHVKVFDGDDLSELQSFFAFNVGFSGGVRVAAGDVNDDGQVDIVTAAGPGGGPHVKAFDGDDLTLLQSFFAFPSASGGVFVAVGDVDGDDFDDIIAGPGSAFSSVRVFSGFDGAILTEIVPFGPGFTGGIRVGAEDIDGDGDDDIFTAAGPGGGPHVKVFDDSAALLASFFAFPGVFTGGVNPA